MKTFFVYKPNLLVLIVIAFLMLANASWGQSLPDSSKIRLTANDTLTTDSLLAQTDSLSADSVKPKKGDFETSINYNARDSMRFDLPNQKAYLYGEAKVIYGDLELTADIIELDWQNNNLIAYPSLDSNGNEVGIPHFKQRSEEFEAKRIKYNFKTEKGIINQVVTKQGEGFIHGGAVKRIKDGDVFIKGAKYTTCDLEHPHFHVRADKIKMNKKNNIITGPFVLYFDETPTPLGFLFGFFPARDQRSSGIIIPQYGESREQGFFLRNGGYYWAMNDYVGVSILGEIYSKGSYGLNIMTDYTKKYSYAGSSQLRYNRINPTDDGIGEALEDFWLSWQHRPQKKGTSSFNANVNMGTNTYNKRNSFSTNNFLSTNFNSAITYSKAFSGTPFSMSASFRQDQNVTTGAFNTNFPNVNFSAARINPFKSKTGNGNKWYERISFSYNGTYNNRSSTLQPTKFTLTDKEVRVIDNIYELPDSNLALAASNLPIMWNRRRDGATHSIPFSTTLNVLRYLSVSPGFNYNEQWHFSRMRFDYQSDSNVLMVNRENGLYRLSNYSANVNLNTRIYGTFNFRNPNIRAMRHTLAPNLGFSYSPDFSLPQYGAYQNYRFNNRDYRLTPYNLSAMGPSAPGEQRVANFSLDNILELKVKDKSDSTKKTKKIPIFENFGIGGNYNFAADSFNLSDFGWNFRTKLFERFNINLTGVITPYQYIRFVTGVAQNGDTLYGQQRISRYLAQDGLGLGQLTNVTFNVGTSLNPDALKPKGLKKADKDLTADERQMLAFINANPDLYVDFSVPWDLRADFYITYTKFGFEKSRYTPVLNFNGNISLTPKWKIQASSGWDFENQKLNMTQLQIIRDLHCWEMSINWIPFGQRQSYVFNLNVRATILRDAKITRQNSWYDRRASQ